MAPRTSTSQFSKMVRRGRQTSQSGSAFPADVHEALCSLPESTNRLLGLAPLPRGRQRPRASEIQELEESAGCIAGHFGSLSGSPASTSEEWTAAAAVLALRGGAVALALLRLVAAAVRRPLAAGVPSSQHGDTTLLTLETCCVALGVAGIILQSSSSTASPASSQFARKLLHMDTLQALARQLAGWTQQPLVTARAGREQVARALNLVLGFLSSTCVHAEHSLRDQVAPSAPPFVGELATALRDSHIMEHAAQLLMRLMQGASRPKETATLNPHLKLFLSQYTLVGEHILGPPAAPSPAAVELAEAVSGPCADHVAMVVGLRTLCAADGGPVYGMPQEIMQRVPVSAADNANHSGPGPKFNPDGRKALAVAALLSVRAGRLGWRAARHILMRVCRLAVASAQAAGAQGGGGDRGQGAATGSGQPGPTAAGGAAEVPPPAPRMLLPSPDGSKLGVRCLAAVWEMLQSRPAGWLPVAEEWWKLVLALCEAGAAAGGLEEEGELVLSQLGTMLVLPLTELDPDAPLPPVAPPAMTAALAGGLLPGLERLMRRAGEDAHGPDAVIADGMGEPWRPLTLALLYGDPRQAAALVATMGKALRRVEAGVGQPGGSLIGTWQVMTAVHVLRCGVGALMDRDSQAPAAAPAAAATQMSYAGHAYAAYEWLPLLSQMLRTGAVGEHREDYASICRVALIWLGALSVASMSGSGGAVGKAQAEGEAEAEDAAAGSRTNASSGGVGDTGGWRELLVGEVDAVALMGAALRLLNVGEVGDADVVFNACIALTAAFPEAVRSATVMAAAAGGPSGSSGGGGGEASLHLPWPPGLVRGMGRAFEAAGRDVRAAAAEALATQVEGWAEGSGREDDPLPDQLLAAEASLAGYWGPRVRLLTPPTAARRLIPTCSNPRCTSLRGDSELGVRLQGCGKCGAVGYCCRECQLAHWRAGHKEECQQGVRRSEG